MLSIRTWKSADSIVSYYDHEQDHFDYYMEGDSSGGTAIGIDDLGVGTNEKIEKQTLEYLLTGKSPVGKSLVQGAGINHRPGYDLTFSAPKSISVVWALADATLKKKLQVCHNEAVNEALKYIENYAGKARRGKGGRIIEPVKNLMFAKYNHFTSRENDPQIHTHCLLFNFAERKDGTFGAIESKYIFQEMIAAGAIYRAELAYKLKNEVGLAVKRVKNAFEISGVNEEVIKTFSSRRSQIEDALMTKGYSSARSSEIAALSTRRSKEAVSFNELLSVWNQKTAGKVKLKSLFKADRAVKEDIRTSEILGEITNHQSTFSERDIRKSLALKSQTLVNRSGFDRKLKEILASDELVLLSIEKGGTRRFTTKAMHALEKKMLESAENLSKRNGYFVNKIIAKREIIRSERKNGISSGVKITMTDEQRQMVYKLTSESGDLKIALGIAGSGKSFALKVAKSIWEKQGFKVVGMAPTGKASINLSNSTDIKSSTIDSFFLPEKIRSARKTVIVVDEAGMIGSRKMEKLLDFVANNSSKLVLVGDTDQLQPVEAGGALNMLEKRIGSFRLNQIYRQKEEWQRNATKFFSQGNAFEALMEYKKNGQIDIFSTPERAHLRLVQDYISEAKASPMESKIIIAETNFQANVLNIHIRNQLILDGKLKNQHEIGIKNRIDEVENRKFSVGDRLLFTKNNKSIGIYNGNFGEVLRITRGLRDHEMTVKLDSGKKIKFKTRDYNYLENGYAVTIYKSQGDTVDKTFFLLSEKTSREAAYVALSRHRKNAKIYIDRTSFSELIDWQELKNVQNSDKKISKIEHKTLVSAAQKASKSQKKDTSLDYSI